MPPTPEELKLLRQKTIGARRRLTAVTLKISSPQIVEELIEIEAVISGIADELKYPDTPHPAVSYLNEAVRHLTTMAEQSKSLTDQLDLADARNLILTAISRLVPET